MLSFFVWFFHFWDFSIWKLNGFYFFDNLFLKGTIHMVVVIIHKSSISCFILHSGPAGICWNLEVYTEWRPERTIQTHSNSAQRDEIPVCLEMIVRGFVSSLHDVHFSKDTNNWEQTYDLSAKKVPNSEKFLSIISVIEKQIRKGLVFSGARCMMCLRFLFLRINTNHLLWNTFHLKIDEQPCNHSFLKVECSHSV